MSLVLILRVFCVRRVYRGSIFFSLVRILHIPTYLGIKGDHFFTDLRIFFGAHFTYKLMYYNLYYLSNFTQIECIEFVCNKFVFVLVQIDQIRFEFSNCIRSICTKTNTNLLHTNWIHSILRINQMNLRKIRQVTQIVVHRFVHETSAKKNS